MVLLLLLLLLLQLSACPAVPAVETSLLLLFSASFFFFVIIFVFPGASASRIAASHASFEGRAESDGFSDLVASYIASISAPRTPTSLSWARIRARSSREREGGEPPSLLAMFCRSSSSKSETGKSRFCSKMASFPREGKVDADVQEEAAPREAAKAKENQLLKEVPAKDLKRAKAVVKGGWFKKGKGGGKELFAAAEAGDEAMARALIAVGAELNWTDDRVSGARFLCLARTSIIALEPCFSCWISSVFSFVTNSHVFRNAPLAAASLWCRTPCFPRPPVPPSSRDGCCSTTSMMICSLGWLLYVCYRSAV